MFLAAKSVFAFTSDVKQENVSEVRGITLVGVDRGAEPSSDDPGMEGKVQISVQRREHLSVVLLPSQKVQGR